MYIKDLNLKLKNGQMMIEALVALGIVLVVLVTLMSAATLSLKNVRRSKDMILANHYAQLQMEKVKAVKNRESLSTVAPACSPDACCYGFIETASSAMNIVLCDIKTNWWTPVGTEYKVKVEISEPEGVPINRVKVNSVVAWTDSDCPTTNVYCHQSQLESYMTEWEN